MFWIRTFKGSDGAHVGPMFGLCWAMLSHLEPSLDLGRPMPTTLNQPPHKTRILGPKRFYPEIPMFFHVFFHFPRHPQVPTPDPENSKDSDNVKSLSHRLDIRRMGTRWGSMLANKLKMAKLTDYIVPEVSKQACKQLNTEHTCTALKVRIKTAVRSV